MACYPVLVHIKDDLNLGLLQGLCMEIIIDSIIAILLCYIKPMHIMYFVIHIMSYHLVELFFCVAGWLVGLLEPYIASKEVCG